MSQGKTERIRQLQFLRFLAFLMIFTFHAGFFGKYSSKINGAVAVTFFFLLSGFLEGYKGKTGTEFPGLKKCWLNAWKLIKKVYPLYLLTTLAALSYSDILNTVAYHNFSSFQGPPAEFVRCLLLVQSWFPKGYFSFNGVGWFLSTLLFLRFIEPPVLFLIGKLKKESKAVLFAVLIAANAVYCFAARGLNPEYWLYIFPVSRIFEYFAAAILGMCFRGWQRAGNGNSSCNKTAAGILEILVLTAWIALAFINGPQWITRDLAWILPGMVLITVFAAGKGFLSEAFSADIPVLLGDLSFESYLIHQVLINIFLAMCHIRGVSLAGDTVGYAMTLFMTLLAAWLIHKDRGGSR